MNEYHKLVRDNIPKILLEDNLDFKIKTLTEEEFEKALRVKLIEETQELLLTTNQEELIEELADIYDVLDCILITHKLDLFDIHKVRIKKNMEKGGFENKVFLEYTKQKG